MSLKLFKIFNIKYKKKLKKIERKKLFILLFFKFFYQNVKIN